ncbi:hypothetical protein K469DRAFT_323064 [Zopfia rhizophila CBS 207.26]|uniref:Uncharacterized protein n=1 Tax=Zopfia rhizophila CBS 207.26 TaxID=1314779 RepID=A0A6A6DI39_9PEZI|nr:hypothetical protein K469DRAFT_323064 [Zopfia rhizophila CBS 207.26]
MMYSLRWRCKLYQGYGHDSVASAPFLDTRTDMHAAGPIPLLTAILAQSFCCTHASAHPSMSRSSAAGFGSAWPKPPPHAVSSTSIRTSMNLDCMGILPIDPVSAHIPLGLPFMWSTRQIPLIHPSS